MSHYDYWLKSLIDRCDLYRKGMIGTEALQQHIGAVAGIVVAVEEAELRDFLLGAEGSLDMIRFTAEQEREFSEAVLIADEITRVVSGWIDTQ